MALNAFRLPSAVHTPQAAALRTKPTWHTHHLQHLQQQR
jgi:hypothetical protein